MAIRTQCLQIRFVIILAIAVNMVNIKLTSMFRNESTTSAYSPFKFLIDITRLNISLTSRATATCIAGLMEILFTSFFILIVFIADIYSANPTKFPHPVLVSLKNLWGRMVPTFLRSN